MKNFNFFYFTIVFLLSNLQAHTQVSGTVIYQIKLNKEYITRCAL